MKRCQTGSIDELSLIQITFIDSKLKNIVFGIFIIPRFAVIMLIESNRLNQKIKKLKDELTRERELRRDAEKQLKAFKESDSFNKNQRSQNYVLDFTEPLNIGAFIDTDRSPRLKAKQLKEMTYKKVRFAEETSSEAEDSLEETKRLENIQALRNREALIEFLIHFSKMILDHNALGIISCYRECERNFLNCDWLTLDIVEQRTENKTITLLFNELFIRCRATTCSMKKSWNIYQELLSDRNSLNLPGIWILDIMNEFFFKYQSYSPPESTVKAVEWNKTSITQLLISLLPKLEVETFNQDSELGLLAFIQLIRIYTYFEDHQEVSKLLASNCHINENTMKSLDPELFLQVYYETGFSFLILGRFSDAVPIFLSITSTVKKTSLAEQHFASIRVNTERCLGFCISSNPKIKKMLPKNKITTIESTYQNEIEEWKDGKIEAFWKFFAECSPFILKKMLVDISQWKTHNFNHIKFCIQRVTVWKPLRNLRGLLKTMESLPYCVLPNSILPLTTEADIKFFCDNNNGLNRLVNSKLSVIGRVLEDFPSIHRKETLTLLIMKYHEALSKQKNDDKVLGFGRKFVCVLKVIGCSGKISVEDTMCYIREVSKISMEAANKIVEDQCKL